MAGIEERKTFLFVCFVCFIAICCHLVEEYVIARPFAVTIQVITSKYMIGCDKLREI